MNQACLYHKANAVQRHDAEQIMAEFSKKIQWRFDGTDSLLDVGSGSGDVLIDFIYPVVPKMFKRVVGSDISKDMVKYAQKCYKSYENCDFKVLDIATETDLLPQDLKGQFDHVTSFYCFHWVQNQRQALDNIYQLLRPEGGDCLLVFLAANPIFDIYKILSKSPKWSSYMKDVDQFISPLHFSEDAGIEFSQMLEDAGFEDLQVELKEKVYIYEGLKILKDNVKAICPFFDRIPLALHDEFIDDFLNIVTNLDLKHYDSNSGDCRITTPYKLLIAYARKPAAVQSFIGDLIVNSRDIKDMH